MSADTSRGRLSPLGAVVRGVVAGAVGTVAMDLLWYARYRRDGGKSRFDTWEFSLDVDSWDQTPAPAQVGKRLVEGLFDIKIPTARAGLVNNVTHWGYGILGGVEYSIVAGSLRSQRIGYGLAFGAGVWASSYVVLPAAKLYKPIWDYDRKTLPKDLSAHLVYGATTAAAFKALSRSAGGTATAGGER
jgi:hypothetical protein